MAATRIDCDIHPSVGGTRTTLLPYLDDHWKEQVVSRAIDGLDLNSYPPNMPFSLLTAFRSVCAMMFLPRSLFLAGSAAISTGAGLTLSICVLPSCRKAANIRRYASIQCLPPGQFPASTLALVRHRRHI